MKIIDIHTHIADARVYPESFLKEMSGDMVESIAAKAAESDEVVNKEKIFSLIRIFLNDKDGTQLIKQMDGAGIDKSVLLIIDAGIKLEEAEYSIEEIFQHHYLVLKNYPDRFIVFGGIDPGRGKNGLELFKKGVYEYGFKGLKLYPPLGYQINDQRLNEYYEICSQHKLPVIIHCGPSLPTLMNEFAEPRYIFDVASRYPDVFFILAHAGHQLTNTIFQLVSQLPNIYLDISGFQTKFPQLNQHMIDSLTPLFQEKLNHRVLFGTDWPLFGVMTPTSTYVKMITQLFNEISHQGIAERALENIFYNNALHVLGDN